MKNSSDVDMQGDYAGGTFKANCPWIQESCEEYVRKNPQAFSNLPLLSLIIV